jgi:PPK2 family polyphosphate:nucleotide phosphotransferase
MPDSTPVANVAQELKIGPQQKVSLRDSDADRTFGWDKPAAERAVDEHRKMLKDLQYKLYADGRFGFLIVLQGIDAGGKDGTIRHVITAFNPQGCTVTSFKSPSKEELKHDFLWRIHKHAPARGEIAVFNRSHYEDVLVVRVDNLVPESVWSRRYEQINAFERMLVENDIHIVKIFLYISKDEQKERLEARLADPGKHWKFDPADLEKRAQWKEYGKAFEAAISRCSTDIAPWYVIPADRKWFRDFAVSQILVQELSKLPLEFPRPAFDPGKIRVS